MPKKDSYQPDSRLDPIGNLRRAQRMVAETVHAYNAAVAVRMDAEKAEREAFEDLGRAQTFRDICVTQMTG